MDWGFSLISKCVNVLALTATAITEILSVMERLSVHNFTVVSKPPSRDNIRYEIKPKVS